MDQYLYIVFRFKENEHYQLLYIFDKDGQLNLGEENLEQTFYEKESLVSKVLSFIDENQYQGAYLLSANDFNVGLETCHEKSEFLKLFETHGALLEMDKSLSKKSFLDRFF